MPVDGQYYLNNRARACRATLAHELRTRPPRYWDFCYSDTCAIPVAYALFGAGWRYALGLTPRQSRRIFGIFIQLFPYSTLYRRFGSQVTPAMVADALEAVR